MRTLVSVPQFPRVASDVHLARARRGVRTGIDIARALAMGADAVTIARPWVFGVAAGGQEGVERVIDIYAQEFAQTLALIGANRASEIDAEFASVPDAWRERDSAGTRAVPGHLAP